MKITIEKTVLPVLKAETEASLVAFCIENEYLIIVQRLDLNFI